MTNPDQVDWDDLPADCVLAIHWQRHAAFEERLKQHRFRVIVPKRHPLDVLISILHYATTNSSTLNWLSSEFGDERSIYGTMPNSRTLLEYATAPRFRALLNVSDSWLDYPDRLQVKYEDLVQDAAGELKRLLTELSTPGQCPVEEVVAKHQIRELRLQTTDSFHFWQGAPNLWRRLLLPGQVLAIKAALADIFQRWDYQADPDESLSLLAAERAWIEIATHEWANALQSLPMLKQNLRIQSAIAAEKANLATAYNQLEAHYVEYITAAEAESVRLVAHRDALQYEVEVLRHRVGNIGARALRIARGLTGLKNRLQRIWAARVRLPGVFGK